MVTLPDNRADVRSLTPAEAAQQLVGPVLERVTSSHGSVFVAIDGRSGAGKSTLAAALAHACDERGVTVTVIEGDQFYAGGTAERWDLRSPAEKADQVIDWRRQQRVLDDLRTQGSASWNPFDWNAPDWDSDPAPLRAAPESCASADVVILEGAYSARPELHDVIDILVLLDTPPAQRRQQLLEREGDEYRADWEGRWSVAEDHYFTTTMPIERFDHVVR